MAKQIFVNLPVKNLQKSIGFFTGIGFVLNEKFTNEQGACLVVAEGSIYIMLLQEEFFQTFTHKPIANAIKATEVVIAFDATSKDEVITLANKVVAAGGTISREPLDHGWMYQQSFADLDGHMWEILFMDDRQLPDQ